MIFCNNMTTPTACFSSPLIIWGGIPSCGFQKLGVVYPARPPGGCTTDNDFISFAFGLRVATFDSQYWDRSKTVQCIVFEQEVRLSQKEIFRNSDTRWNFAQTMYRSRNILFFD